MLTENIDYTKCAILVMSCDKNISLLKIFFDFFNKNWGDCPFEIFVGLEEKREFFFNSTTILSQNKSFCGRLLEYINIISKPHVLIILDDFILEERVDNDKIRTLLGIMQRDNSVATLTCTWVDSKKDYEYMPGIMKSTYNANYIVNLQVGFWNSEILTLLLKNGENAWQAELFGSIRARKYRNYKFLRLESNEEAPYKYNNGWLIVKGAWNGNEIKRLKLQKYVNEFLDGKKILYENFGKTKKIDSAKLVFSILIRKILSHINLYF